MILAVDSCVLLAIMKNERGGAGWLEFLLQCRDQARLVICDVVYAELSSLFDDQSVLDHRLTAFGFEFDPIERSSAHFAGRIFAAYRKTSGPRTNLIPDFLKGAHALRQTGGLLTPDRDYLRQYFSGLKILTPA